MKTYRLSVSIDLPYFAEVPYYVWGQVNYRSDGNCRYPTDRTWTWLQVTNRKTRQRLEVEQADQDWIVQGEDPDAARLALFLVVRCEGAVQGVDPANHVGDWSHEEAMARAARVAEEFARPELTPFDSHHFWGSWKWVGWFATDFTWVGRWIMHSVVRQDPRAVALCIDWLRYGTVAEEQSKALRYALSKLTDQAYRTDAEWLKWYKRKGRKQYPKPDLDSWIVELRSEFGESTAENAS